MKRKSSKKMDMNSLLRSRNALYLVLALAVMNLFSYLMLKQLDAVAFFIIVGFLATYFSKNMIVILLSSMISTFILVQVRLLGNSGREGMENQGDEKKEEKIEGMEVKEKKKEVTEDQPTETEASPSMPITKAQREKITAGGDIKKNEQTEKFTQQLNPARYNSRDDDDTPRHKPKVDYTSTLESAYDNLDKLLSSDAIRNMSDDTSRLAEKQQKLMGNIEKLQPIMDKASSVLKGLDIPGISGLMSGIQGRLKGFGKGGAEGGTEPDEE